MNGSEKPRHWRSRRLQWVAVTLMALVVVTACGGSSDDGSTSADDDAQPDAAETETSEAASVDQEASGNFARVTIGSEIFEIPPDGLNLCNSLDNLIFGSFAIAADGSATQAGGTEAATQINFGVPVANWEDEGLQPPIVNLDLLDEGVRWFASTERGLGSVDSWELANGVATGQATFEGEEVGSGNVLGTEPGSFEIVCR